jgi:hypothetical protein
LIFLRAENQRVNTVQSSPELDDDGIPRAPGPLFRLSFDHVQSLWVGVALVIGIILVLDLTGEPTGTTSVTASAPSKATARSVSFQVGTRPRKTGEGTVLQLKNTMPQAIKNVTVEVLNQDTHANVKATFPSWAPGQLMEIGENDNWTIAPGQVLSIQAEGYDKASLVLK